MILQAFTVYDSGVGSFMRPFFMQSKGEALRSFMDACSDPATAFCKHPKDFTLFHLGQYDDQSASFDQFDTPQPMATAYELIATAKEAK